MNMNISETNPIPEGYHQNVTERIMRSVDWTTPGLKVTRFRILSDPGHPVWDVSYCHGVMPDGEPVDVCLPFSQLPKRGWRRFVVGQAIKEGIHAKRLGILDNVSSLNLR